MKSHGMKGNIISKMDRGYRARVPIWLMMLLVPLILNSCGGGSELHLDMFLKRDLTWEDTSDERTGKKQVIGADTAGLSEKKVSPAVDRLIVTLHIGKKNRLIEQAPFKLAVEPENPKVIKLAETNFTRPARKFIIPVLLKEGQTVLRVNARVYYCEKSEEAQCFIKNVETSVPVKIFPGGSDVFRLELDCR